MNISSKQIQWVLKKATPTITLSKSSLSLSTSTLTGTFTITRSGDGVIGVSSSNISIATVSLSGNTATVTAKANGSCTITVNVTESSNYLSKNTSLPVSVSLVGSLNDSSWETISQLSQAGTASNYWSVGDTKDVTLSGTVETVNMSGTYKACILGFDHNASLETNGDHSIHFIIGKDGTDKDICFYPFKMHSSDTTWGGWNQSIVKSNSYSFKMRLPSDLQNVIKSVTKYTHNTTGGSANNTAANVTATTEEIFILAEYEVFGSNAWLANPYEKDKQAQYQYYANGNSTNRYGHKDGELKQWWLRSARCQNFETTGFCAVLGNTFTGIPSSYKASSPIGVAPAFVV